MFNSFLTALSKVFVAPLVFTLSLAGYSLEKQVPQSIPDYSQDIYHIQEQINDLKSKQSEDYSPNLGSTFNTTQNIAFFQTSLATGISSSQTSMTLVSGAYNNGANTLASSSYAFVLDEGTATQEMVKADCTATACTNIQRGIDFLTGSSTVSTLQFAHRRGASVKITTAPTLLTIGNIFKGSESIESPIKYNSSVSTTTLAADRNSLASSGLVADVAFSGAGVINATTAAKGVVQIGTQLQTASSTNTCSSGAICVIPTSNATSTYNSATASLRVIVTQNDGSIDKSFITNLSSTTAVANTGSTLTQLAPVGSIIAYASTTPPTGWLLLDGSSLLRATYPYLFNLLGVSYGSVDGTHFTLPDMRGRNILTASTTANIGQTGGESNHTQTVAELAPHTHTNPVVASGAGGTPSTILANGAASTNTSAASNSTGGGGAMNVLDPYIVFSYIIKY